MSQQIKRFHPKLFPKKRNNPSIKTGVKLFNNHTAGRLNAHNADVEVLFLNIFLHSFNDSKNKFSNYVTKLGIKNTSTYHNLISLSKSPSQIAKELSPIDIYHRQNSQRIKEILSHEIPSEIIDYFGDSIFESVVERGSDFLDANGKGKFRVFSIYAIDQKNLSNGVQKLIVILIDPYHLVCPVEDKDKLYKKYNFCDDSLEAVFQDIFKDSDAVKFVSLDAFKNN